MPAAVDILPDDSCATVAMDNTIWVHHREDPEDEVVAKKAGNLVVVGEEIYETLDDVAAVGLGRVLARKDDDTNAILPAGGLRKIRYHELRALVLAERLRDWFLLEVSTKMSQSRGYPNCDF